MYCARVLFFQSSSKKCLTVFFRSSGNFKRPVLNVLPRELTQEIRAKYLNSREELTDDEWRNLQENLISSYRNINRGNLDAMVLGIFNKASHLNFAKNYIQFLRRNGNEANQATLGRLLKIYNLAYHENKANKRDFDFPKVEQNEILKISSYLREKHDILDAATCENLILGLVATSQWRDSLELLRMTRISATPSVNAYCEIATRAFSEYEFDLGWEMLEQMLADRKQPKCEVFLALIQSISSNPNPEFFRMEFEKLLSFLEKYELVLTQKVVDFILNLGRISPSGCSLTAHKASINRIGKCSNCALSMQHVSISDEEFDTLRDCFLERVLIRKDVFQKSTPEEVAQFKDYVERTQPYDCVIDGLNVAYSTGSKKPPKVLANLLVSVVKYFKQRRKHVLVLGRQHMNQWPKDSMRFIKQNAALFLANNLSHDDPFLLYATLKSGQGTDFFSRDLMRTHSFLLGPELKSTFRRWQQEHQYSLVTQIGSGQIIVKEPVRHLICAHKVGETWHLPYKAEYSANPADTFEIPESWLCLALKN